MSTDAEFRRRLEKFATKNGVDLLEKKARAAIAAGRTAEAAHLRNEALALMRKGEAEIKRQLKPVTAASVIPTRIQASRTRLGHTVSLRSS